MTLHNFLRRDYMLCGNQDDHRIFEVEHPSDSWLDLPPMSNGQNHSQAAKEIRNEFTQYFNMEGAVSGKWSAARVDL